MSWETLFPKPYITGWHSIMISSTKHFHYSSLILIGRRNFWWRSISHYPRMANLKNCMIFSPVWKWPLYFFIPNIFAVHVWLMMLLNISVLAASRHDDAAQKVEVLASVEARLLFMHTGYKVGSFSVGNLVRTKIKVAINPFPEVNNLISKAHKFLTHFSYGSHRYNQL